MIEIKVSWRKDW